MTTIRTLILAVFLTLPLAAQAEEKPHWTIEKLNQLIVEVKDAVLGEEGESDSFASTKGDDFLERLKKRAVVLANKAGAEFKQLKHDVTEIVNNLRGLEEEKLATVEIDEENRQANVRLHMNVAEDVATELGVDQKMELAEIRVAWNERNRHK